MGRIEGKLPHRRGFLVSLKGWTGRKKSLEKIMKGWLRNLTHHQNQITGPCSVQLSSDFTLQAIGKQRWLSDRVTRSKDDSSGPRKDGLANGSLRLRNKQEGDDSKRPGLISGKPSQNPQPGSTAKFSIPRISYTSHIQGMKINYASMCWPQQTRKTLH